MDEWQSVGVSKKRRTGEALLHVLNDLNFMLHNSSKTQPCNLEPQ